MSHKFEIRHTRTKFWKMVSWGRQKIYATLKPSNILKFVQFCQISCHTLDIMNAGWVFKLLNSSKEIGLRSDMLLKPKNMLWYFCLFMNRSYLFILLIQAHTLSMVITDLRNVENKCKCLLQCCQENNKFLSLINKII